MSINFQRPFRESLSNRGLFRLNNQEFQVIVQNISINGALVNLQSKKGSEKALEALYMTKNRES